MERKRLLALALALVMVMTLAACGKKKNDQVIGGADGPTDIEVSDVQENGEDQTPAEPAPEAPETPDSPDEEEKPEEEQKGDAPQEEKPGDVVPLPQETQAAISHTDVTFKAPGDRFTLSVKNVEGKTTFASADEAVATVDENGLVTAVGPGTTTITAVAEGDMAFSCIIRCSWTAEEQPQEPQDGATAGAVDLKAFYTDVAANYSLSGMMTEMTDSELMDTYFPGLSAVELKQQALYYTMITMNNGEISMVEVSNSADVETVKAAFQARVDSMINGGAWYPEPTRIWTDCSRVVSYGNYVLMVVSEDCDSILADFEALLA